MIRSRLVLVYGPDRFPSIRTLRARPSLPWTTAALFLGLAAPCIVMTCCGTMTLVWWQKLAGIVVAASIAVAILWLTAKLHFYIEPGTGTSGRSLYPSFQSAKPGVGTGRSYIGKRIDRKLRSVLPGETHLGLLTADGRLHSGHQLAATTLAVSIAVYAAVGITSHHLPLMRWQVPKSLASQLQHRLRPSFGTIFYSCRLHLQNPHQ